MINKAEQNGQCATQLKQLKKLKQTRETKTQRPCVNRKQIIFLYSDEATRKKVVR